LLEAISVYHWRKFTSGVLMVAAAGAPVDDGVGHTASGIGQ
jgi:hypothetical protein